MELKSLRETVNVITTTKNMSFPCSLFLQCETKTGIRYFKDEIIKLKGGFQLDVNLEKNRSTEVVSAK